MGGHHGNKLVVGHSYQYKNAYSRNKGCIVNKMLSVIHDTILKMKVTKIAELFYRTALHNKNT